jgi:hypothetical protein
MEQAMKHPTVGEVPMRFTVGASIGDGEPTMVAEILCQLPASYSVEDAHTEHPTVVISLDLERRVADGLKAFAEAFERA